MAGADPPRELLTALEPEPPAASGSTEARPAHLELFQTESCPYCRKVRQTLALLELEYVVRQAPRGSENRARLVARGGLSQVPYLVDGQTGVELYESDDIVAYLLRQYGGDRNVEVRRRSPLAGVGAALRSLFGRRPAERGSAAPDAEAVELRLYQAERSPDGRAVRECLAELALDYVTRSVVDSGPLHEELREACGGDEVPCLVDLRAEVVVRGAGPIEQHLRSAPRRAS